MTNKITMRFTKVDGHQFVPTGAWLVTPRSWLERLCWRFLYWRKRCVPHCGQEAIVHHVVIDPDKAARAIIMESGYLLQEMGSNPVKVLLGPRDFARLMADSQPYDFAFSFSAELPMHRSILGLEVQVVPHMDGILVL